MSENCITSNWSFLDDLGGAEVQELCAELPTLKSCQKYRSLMIDECQSTSPYMTQMHQEFFQCDRKLLAGSGSGLDQLVSSVVHRSPQGQAKHRELEIYDRETTRITDLRLKYEPEKILALLGVYLRRQANQVVLHELKYKMKATFITEDDRIEVKFSVSSEICDGFNMGNYLEIRRYRGDPAEFYKIANKIRGYFREIAANNTIDHEM
mmetsp:Transcript_38211/g.43353  ORF Transcript_38211/g.43353 Transcript_38211/m.43353 type:complete len:209 (+) Transcript_38211:568-1194(+)